MYKFPSATCMVFIQWWCERGAKSHVSKEISGRGRRRSRGVKGNQGVGDFRFITTILQFFSIYYYYYFIIFLQDLKIKVLTEQEEFQKFVYKHAKANHHLYNYIHPNGWDYFKVITLSLCCLSAIYFLSYISLNGN